MNHLGKIQGGFNMSDHGFIYEDSVRSTWVDYNGHMNDAAYAQVFSLAVDAFMDFIQLDEAGREQHHYTIFTLETHLCYLQEGNENDALRVTSQLIDVDEKRLHIFFEMKNSEGEVIATSEQMLMGMDTNAGRPASFPDPVQSVIDQTWRVDQAKEAPKQQGRTIGIRR